MSFLIGQTRNLSFLIGQITIFFQNWIPVVMCADTTIVKISFQNLVIQMAFQFLATTRPNGRNMANIFGFRRFATSMRSSMEPLCSCIILALMISKFEDFEKLLQAVYGNIFSFHFEVILCFQLLWN